MSLSNLASFGGMLKINGKEYSVKGRTYRKIAEQQSWWISQCFCPITELRSFLYSHPSFLDKDFILQWLKTGRRENIVDLDLQQRVMSTFSARRFDIWQACRDDGLKIEEIDEHLDALDNQQLAEFFEEADRKMSIANGIGEFDFLANCHKTVPVPNGKSRSIEAMIAQVCVRNKNRMSLEEVLDSTPEMLKVLFEEPENLIDDAEAERALHPNDKVGRRRFEKIYENMAANISSGQRIDAPRPKEPKDKKREA